MVAVPVAQTCGLVGLIAFPTAMNAGHVCVYKHNYDHILCSLYTQIMTTS